MFSQQYWQQQPEQFAHQQPMDQQQQQYIGQPPSQQWNQPPVSGTCFAPVSPLQQQQHLGHNHHQATAAYERPDVCGGSSDSRLAQYAANNGIQFTAISSPQQCAEGKAEHNVLLLRVCGGDTKCLSQLSVQFCCLPAAQQPNRNVVYEGHEAHVNIAAVDHHQHQEQQHNQTSRRIPTFAATQAGAMEQLCGARGRLRSVGMGVPGQQQYASNDSHPPSVFEGRGVAVEKQLDHKHVDTRRACLASGGGDDGEEVVIGTSVESSEFQAMHQKLRHTNLQ